LNCNKIIDKEKVTKTLQRGRIPKFCSYKCSNSNKFNGMYGKKHSIETKNKISESEKGKKINEETIKKMRISAKNRLIDNKIFPNFNKKSIEWFKNFDKKNNTKGFYGKNEYCIEELGYWVDYINFDLKLIIEWDEEYHYDLYNNLKQKDIKRQQEIQEYFFDFDFKRIRERRVKS
jgi:hypothetical protein